ncbi:hypothetical protein BWQ92_00985 [Arthrobacter sp. QXT-31]|nr:hypothetical protein BWQ92_00985 [Arthrobacter sp. QXT-31]
MSVSPSHNTTEGLAIVTPLAKEPARLGGSRTVGEEIPKGGIVIVYFPRSGGGLQDPSAIVAATVVAPSFDVADDLSSVHANIGSAGASE